MVKYIEAMKRPFSDIEKALVGIILSIVPIVNFLVLGYAIVSSKKRKTLPKWKNWKDLFIKGLKAAVIGFVLLLPSMVLVMAGAGLLLASSGFSSVVNDLMTQITSSLMSGGQISQGTIAQILLNNWQSLTGVMVLAVPLFVSAFVVGLIGLYITPISTLEWFNKKDLGAAFTGKVLNKCFKGEYFINWLIVGIISALVGFLLGFIPFFGPAISMFFSMVFSYTVFGEVYTKL